jgi:hypothetical protein
MHYELNRNGRKGKERKGRGSFGVDANAVNVKANFQHEFLDLVLVLAYFVDRLFHLNFQAFYQLFVDVYLLLVVLQLHLFVSFAPPTRKLLRRFGFFLLLLLNFYWDNAWVCQCLFHFHIASLIRILFKDGLSNCLI